MTLFRVSRVVAVVDQTLGESSLGACLAHYTKNIRLLRFFLTFYGFYNKS
jgi:hypothetical protein